MRDTRCENCDAFLVRTGLLVSLNGELYTTFIGGGGSGERGLNENVN